MTEGVKEAVVMRRVTRRLIPFLFLMYIFNYLDRVNVSIAALTMKGDLHLSDAVYGFGAGVFFLGYFLFEVPSNLILERVGARRWMARIMVSWGLISAAMMFVSSTVSFYVLRFLLGIAEAGFFPGMILYLSYWFPSTERARAVARFMTAIPLATVFGSPLSGLLLKMHGLAGLHGWQWLFLLEGIPSVLVGVAALFYLTDRPEDAHWLEPDEREWLSARLREERESRDRHHGFGLAQAFAHPRVLLLCLLYFCLVIGGYGLSFWLPLILKARSDWGDSEIALMAAIPALAAAIGMRVIAGHSDRGAERRRYVAVCAIIAAVGMAVGALTGSPIVTLAGFAVAELARMSTMGPFWALSTNAMSAAATAGGLAFINSVGNLGGFAGPYAMGKLKESTGGFSVGVLVLAGVLIIAAVVALTTPAEAAPEPAPAIT